MGHRETYEEFWKGDGHEPQRPYLPNAALREVESEGGRIGPPPKSDPELNNLLVQAKANDALVTFASGATSSKAFPAFWRVPIEGLELEAARFNYGNHKHEHDNPVHSQANWLIAFHARDVAFYWDRATHAVEHIWREMRGDDDFEPGGNIGGARWFTAIMAFTKKYDPELYEAIQGKRNLAKEAQSAVRVCQCPFCVADRRRLSNECR